MIKVTVQRNLLGLEDLLTGVGVVEQTRNGQLVPVTRINGANLPYDGSLTLEDKFNELLAEFNEIIVVNEDGEVLSGLITVSPSQLDLSNRIWIKTIDADEAEFYYDSILLFRFNPTDGNLIIDLDLGAYVAGDAAVTAAFQAADAVVTAAFQAADVVVTNAMTALINARASVTQGSNVACNANTTYTINIADGVWHKLTFTSNCTIAFTFPAGEVKSMVLELVNAGAYTVTWPAGVKVNRGDVLEFTAAGTDLVTVAQDGNNTRYVTIWQQDSKTAT